MTTPITQIQHLTIFMIFLCNTLTYLRLQQKTQYVRDFLNTISTVKEKKVVL